MNNDLATALLARNAAILAWVAESPATRWATTLSTDLAYWASYGVFTAEQLDHYLLVCDVFEASRAAYGFKPSWACLMAADNATLRRELEMCQDMLRREREAELAFERAEAAAYQAALRSRSGWSIGEIVGL